MRIKAFTLAEVMIVLTVIGIISAIIMPIALHSVPDENVLKFKKANSTLYQVVQELVNSDKYYKDGDLGLKPDGSYVDSNINENDSTYLCTTMADILSVKKVNCSKHLDKLNKNAYYCVDWFNSSHSQTNKEWDNDGGVMDLACKTKAGTVGAEIILSDGTIIYQSSPAMTFGYTGGADLYWGGVVNGRFFYTNDNTDEGVSYRCSKVICIDVDGINKGEDPFGYGIRVDGKITPGTRAAEWLEKDIQGE